MIPIIGFGEEQPVEVRKCIYVAGVAREVQDIRHKTGDDFSMFLRETDRIYKRDEGYKEILKIARHVYSYVPIDAELDKVFDVEFNNCIALEVQEEVWN